MIVPQHDRRVGSHVVTYRERGRKVTRTFRTADHAAAFARGRRSARVAVAA